MVNTVAELVEQGDHFIVRKQRWFVADWAVEVTRQVRHWGLQLALCINTAHAAFIHPSAATFVFTRIEIKVEAATQRALRIENIEETHRVVPDVNAFALFHAHAKHTFEHFKQTADGFRLREVRTQFFIRNLEQVLSFVFRCSKRYPTH